MLRSVVQTRAKSRMFSKARLDDMNAGLRSYAAHSAFFANEMQSSAAVSGTVLPTCERGHRHTHPAATVSINSSRSASHSLSAGLLQGRSLNKAILAVSSEETCSTNQVGNAHNSRNSLNNSSAS